MSSYEKALELEASATAKKREVYRTLQRDYPDLAKFLDECLENFGKPAHISIGPPTDYRS